jgi:hypothetical protein
MRFKTILACLTALALAAVATAQTKISGTLQCPKADPQHAIEVGDKPNHFLGISKVTCTWTTPMEIAGAKTKEGFSVSSDETTGNKSSGHGIHVSTMDNGDKFHVRFQGSAAVKDGVPQSAEGKWSFVSGTGKLKGIKGGGTYKGKAGADGSMTYEPEGEYQLPK